MRPNLGFYVQTINDIVTNTEKIGETMNPDYEELRQAIDEGKTSEVTAERLSEITEQFEKGTSQYKTMLKQVEALRPPAKVMGIHSKFKRSYEKYVAGCEEMIQAIAPETGINGEVFDAAEKKQDEATDEISFSIQRMTKLLLGK